MSMYKRLKSYVRSKDSGLIYELRLLRAKLNSKIYCLRVSFGMNMATKENQVFIGSYSGNKYTDNPVYIMEEIHKLLPSTKIMWGYRNNIEFDLPSFIVPVSMENVRTLNRAIASSSIVIDNAVLFSGLSYCEKQLRIQTWHGGLGIKKIGLDNYSSVVKVRNIGKNYDFFISNSDYLTRVYRDAFEYSGLIWKCGYPIEDCMLLNCNEREKIHNKYNIPNDTKIVLYAPTYRDKNSWSCDLDVSKLRKAFETRFGGTWCVAVRWHNLEIANNNSLKEVFDFSDFPNMQTLTKGIDAYISDYSSGIFHARLRDIPCFIYAQDYDFYNSHHGLYFSLEELPFPYAVTMDSFIDSILTYDEILYHSKWEEFQNRMGHIVTGHSAEDIAKVCVDFLNGKSKEEIMKEIPFETDY